MEITFDATAREAGVTKGGVLYHFPTRDDLVLGVADYVAQRLDDAMLELLGKPFDDATAAERIRAYIKVVATGQLTRAELAIFVECLANPAYNAPWERTLERWLNLNDVKDADERARLRAAHLAADGLWAADATGWFAPTADREQVVVQLLELAS